MAMLRIWTNLQLFAWDFIPHAAAQCAPPGA